MNNVKKISIILYRKELPIVVNRSFPFFYNETSTIKSYYRVSHDLLVGFFNFLIGSHFLLVCFHDLLAVSQIFLVQLY